MPVLSVQMQPKLRLSRCSLSESPESVLAVIPGSLVVGIFLKPFRCLSDISVVVHVGSSSGGYGTFECKTVVGEQTDDKVFSRRHDHLVLPLIGF